MEERTFFDSFVLARTGSSDLPRWAPIEDVLDSLALLDMFLLIEGSGIDIDLDDIAACTTIGELYDLVTAKVRRARHPSVEPS